MPERRPRKKKKPYDALALAQINAAMSQISKPLQEYQNQINAAMSQISKPLQEYQREMQKAATAGLMWGTLNSATVARLQELSESTNAIADQLRKSSIEIQQATWMAQSLDNQRQLAEYASIWQDSVGQISRSFALLAAQLTVPFSELDTKITSSQLQMALDNVVMFNNSIRLSAEQLDRLRAGAQISPPAVKLARPLEGIDKDLLGYEREAKKWKTYLSAPRPEDKPEEEVNQLKEINEQLLVALVLSKQATAHYKRKYDDLAAELLKQKPKPLDDDRDYQ